MKKSKISEEFKYIELEEEIRSENVDPFTLHFAASKGYLHEIKELITREKVNVDLKDKYGYTPLLNAVIYGQIEAVKLLISLNANIFLENENNVSPLYAAVSRGYLEIVNILLKNGATIYNTNGDFKELIRFDFDSIKKQALNINKRSPLLHLAAKNGDENMCKFLIQHGMNINTVNYYGYTPLHTAAYCGHSKLVSFFINHGANINAKSNSNVTPLISAIQNNCEEVFKILINSGADVNSFKNNTSVLKIAFKNGNESIIKCLLENSPKLGEDHYYLLNLAVSQGSLELIKVLVEKHLIPIDIINSKGFTPLNTAIFLGYNEIAKYLITKGADINLKAKCNKSILHLAARQNKIDVVEYLLSLGMDIDIKDKDGFSPIFEAALFGYYELVKYFVDKGACLTLKSNRHKSLLYTAVLSNNKNILNLLINKGLNIDEPMIQGYTPLHNAIISKCEKSIKILLEAGSSVNYQSNFGETPLILAVNQNEIDLTKMLIKSGANVKNIKLSSFKNQNKQIIKILKENGAS